MIYKQYDDKALFKVEFGRFNAFVLSTKEKIVDDMNNIYDEGGQPLSGHFESIKFICYEYEMLEKNTDRDRL